MACRRLLPTPVPYLAILVPLNSTLVLQTPCLPCPTLVRQRSWKMLDSQTLDRLVVKMETFASTCLVRFTKIVSLSSVPYRKAKRSARHHVSWRNAPLAGPVRSTPLVWAVETSSAYQTARRYACPVTRTYSAITSMKERAVFHSVPTDLSAPVPAQRM